MFKDDLDPIDKAEVEKAFVEAGNRVCKAIEKKMHEILKKENERKTIQTG